MNKGIKLLLILLGFALITACDHTITPKDPENIVVQGEVDKVVLEIPNKENITAGELVQKDIRASGYDPSYAIKYEKIEGNSAAREAKITFFLKKDGLESKKRTVTIKGFKSKTQDVQELSAQEKINAEVDKLILDVPTKEQITAEELKNEHIKASNYDSDFYTVKYKTIKPDTLKKEADITVFLTKNGDILTSKEKTVTITGFKEKSLPPDTIDIAEETLFALFDLTETKITASAAAKKIAQAQGETREGFLFEEAKAVAYDDEKGTFTVKVKGTKEDKIFDKTFNISGFTHPYAEQIWQIVKTGGKGKVKLDAGIENNLSIDKFIEKANAGDGASIKNFFVDALTFSLHTTSSSSVSITLGETDEYILKAQFEKQGDKIKITPEYIVKYNIKNTDGTETVKQDKSYSSFVRVKDDLIQDYFNANDVFQYILNKTDDNFIKVDSNKFASSFYAPTKFLGGIPADLFDMTQITDYIEKYKAKEADEHLKLDIMAGIYNPKNSGIKANDTEGRLTVQYCIATTEQLDGTPDAPAITAISSEITKQGFKKADKNTLKNLFAFKILKQGTGTDEDAKKEWKGYSISGTQAGTYMLFSGENGLYSDILPFPPSMKAKPFKISINNSDTPSSVFTVDTPPYLSEGLNGVKILLNGVVLTKNYGDELLTVTYTLSNGENIEVTYTPLF